MITKCVSSIHLKLNCMRLRRYKLSRLKYVTNILRSINRNVAWFLKLARFTAIVTCCTHRFWQTVMEKASWCQHGESDKRIRKKRFEIGWVGHKTRFIFILLDSSLNRSKMSRSPCFCRRLIYCHLFSIAFSLSLIVFWMSKRIFRLCALSGFSNKNRKYIFQK